MNKIAHVKSIPFLLIVSVWIAVTVNTADAEEYSARIKSLGGRPVAGIIPDFHTDFINNPAVLADLDRSEIFYRLIDNNTARLPFYQLNQSWEKTRPLVDHTSSINGLDIFWGSEASRWKFALSTILKLGKEESSEPESRYYMDEYRIRLKENNADSWKIDLTGAYKMSGGTSFGIRAGGYGFYDMTETQYLTTSSSYRSEYGEKRLYRKSISDDSRYPNITVRRVAAYIQGGVRTVKGKGSFSEISFNISTISNFAARKDWNRGYWYYYDRYSGNDYITEHGINADDYSSASGGRSWVIGVRGRHRTESGYTFSAEGSYERCGYDGSRGQRHEDSEYDYVGEYADERIEKTYISGEGNSDDISAAFRMGKAQRLNSNLNLHFGLAAFASYTGWKFDPVMDKSVYRRQDNDIYYEKLSDRISFSSKLNTFSLFVPASIEYKPAAYFTFYSSLVPDIRCEILREKVMPPGEGLPENIECLMANEITTRNIHTDYNIAAGFTINYGEKLFIDVYTKSDIIPERLYDLDINIRYLF